MILQTSFLILSSSSVLASDPTTTLSSLPFTLCLINAYCSGDIDGIRGSYLTPLDCYTACLSQSSDYQFFDLTTDGSHTCWCGKTCESTVEYPTMGYAIHDGSESPSSSSSSSSLCLSSSPSEMPTTFPTTLQPSSESPTHSPSSTVTPSSLIPSFSPSLPPLPLPPFSICSIGYYCDGDIHAQRGIFTTPDQCYQRCHQQGGGVGSGYTFFDLSEDIGQCWCGNTCEHFISAEDTFNEFNLIGYRMDNGTCPISNLIQLCGEGQRCLFNGGGGGDYYPVVGDSLYEAISGCYLAGYSWAEVETQWTDQVFVANCYATCPAMIVDKDYSIYEIGSETCPSTNDRRRLLRGNQQE